MIERCPAAGRWDGCCREAGHDGPHLWFNLVRVNDGALWGGRRGSGRSAMWVVEGDDEKAAAHLDFKPGPPPTDEELVALGAMLDAARKEDDDA